MPSWIASAWLVSKAQWFWTHNPELQFGWLVLVLCAYLFWEAWELDPPAAPTLRLTALPTGAAGIVLLFVTQIYQAAYGLTAASMSGLGIGTLLVVLANLQIVFRQGLRSRLFFPFAFLLFALPIPSLVYSPVVTTLQCSIASLNVEILNLAGIPARRMGSLINLPAGPLGVDEACSGIRSLQSTLMAACFIGYLSLRRPALRVLLVAAGALIALAGNVVRSLYLSFAASRRGITAVEQLHDAAGWSILLFTAAAVGILAWLLCRLETKVDGLRSPARTIMPEAPAENHLP